MQDPKFEKQVQQKMEELNFSPSDSVWTNIEASINPERKRRKPFFWLFFLLGLSIVAGGYFIINNLNKGTSFKRQQTNVQKGTSKKVETNEPGTRNQKAARQDATGGLGTSGQTIVADNDESTKKLITGNQSEKSSTTKKVNATNHSFIDAQSRRSGPSTYQKNTNGIFKKEKEKKIKSGKNVNATPENDDIVAKDYSSSVNNHPEKTIDNNKDTKSKDSSATSTAVKVLDKKTAAVMEKKQQVNDSLNSNNMVVKANDKNEKKHSWKLGFRVDPGVSDIAGGLFKSAYLNVAPASNNYYSSVTPLSTNANRNAISPISLGFSIAAGIVVQKNLSKRVLFSTGINYHYYSVKTVVGKYIDTTRSVFLPQAATARGYYTDSVSSSYLNRYHFIELPLSLSFQLNRNEKKPLIWEAGFSFSYLAGSNALQYDPSSHIYYKNNRLFNKLQVSTTTGLMYGFNVGKNQLQVGPQVQYGLTRLLNKSTNNAEHLFFGGIKVVWMMK